MGKIILSTEMCEQFLLELQQSTKTFKETLKNAQAAISIVADVLSIGVFDLSMSAPVSAFSPDGIETVENLYHWGGGVEESFLTQRFAAGSQGSVGMVIYPRSGRIWSEDERYTLKFIASQMFFTVNQGRVAALLKRTQVTDELTGLWNSNGLLWEGDRVIREGSITDYSAVYFNIKNFRHINKMSDYVTGNEVLVRYVTIIKKFIGVDEIFARLGGDHFVALVRKEREGELIRFLADVPVTMEIALRVHHFHFAAVAGVYRIDEETKSMTDVIASVTAAYYNAKQLRHQDVTYYKKEFMTRELDEKEIAVIFPEALARGEFHVYYQPKVNVFTNEICGAEALVRWMHMGRVIGPDEFIPVLERDCSVCRLDFYVLENVCRRIRQWLQEGKKVPRISVNFSRWHLLNKSVVDDIMRVIKRCGIDTKYLEIEVTETTNVEDFEVLSAAVRQMKQNGIVTSVDDFGTGYSSLNLIKNLEADVLKIDKSFLESGGSQALEREQKLLQNIVKMAADLNLEVLAEGVETVEQRDYLKSIHCHMAQGYLYDRPLPVEQFEQRILDGQKYVV